MSFLNKLRSGKSEEPSTIPIGPAVPTATTNAEDLEIQRDNGDAVAMTEQKTAVGADDNADEDLKDEVERPDADAQFGVQKVQAITLAWTKKSLAALLILYAMRPHLHLSHAAPLARRTLTDTAFPIGFGFFS